jgi:hypothetical protein
MYKSLVQRYLATLGEGAGGGSCPPAKAKRGSRHGKEMCFFLNFPLNAE